MTDPQVPATPEPNFTPADSATYLDGDLPEYPDPEWDVNGVKVDVSKLRNPLAD